MAENYRADALFAFPSYAAKAYAKQLFVAVGKSEIFRQRGLDANLRQQGFREHRMSSASINYDRHFNHVAAIGIPHLDIYAEDTQINLLFSSSLFSVSG